MPKLLETQGWQVGQVRLSCQAMIHGDVMISVPEESQGNKQIVRKSATQRKIDIQPSLRKYLVEMAPPTLANPQADWERLVKALVVSMTRVRGAVPDLPSPDSLTIDYSTLRRCS